jgi:hypothetical protein
MPIGRLGERLEMPGALADARQPQGYARMNDSLIWNTNFQSLFLSPLIGAIMGIVLVWFFSAPAGERTTIRLSYVRVANIFYTEIHNHFHGATDDHSQEAVALGILVAALFVYADYGLLAIQIIGFVAALTIGFGAVFVVLGLRDRAPDWVIRFVWPVLAAVFACYLLLMATDVMQALSAEPGGLSFAKVIPKILSRYGFFVLFQALGVGLVGSSLIGIVAAVSYYASTWQYVRSGRQAGRSNYPRAASGPGELRTHLLGARFHIRRLAISATRTLRALSPSLFGRRIMFVRKCLPVRSRSPQTARFRNNRREKTSHHGFRKAHHRMAHESTKWDPRFDPKGRVPREGIMGAWTVDQQGQIVGEFQRNPRYRGK